MKIQLDHRFLADIGLAGLLGADEQAFLDYAYETLEHRVGMELAGRMSDDQLAEFERVIDDNDEAGATQWLNEHAPDYRKVVRAEFERLKDELRAQAAALRETYRPESGASP
ncbi:DUF5663 domain-containing protein [Crossiella cryophila]|uniref:Uncharacterized protein n=1 Tax=Crossiella cryophila TaxID=43355 RepID=A0A7W7CA18_9PSEU|nr:DUF5663 domain-containing protein [Crossiella cryophila]MBB4677293.1 hypothetical protein [Crossiella cryophila]